MDVLCRIENINSSNYKNLILRKFFQIVFFSDDFKKIDAYTALVVGGGDNSNISHIKNDFKVAMSFESKENECEVKHSDLTTEFLREENCIRGVWGKECKKISTQKEVEECLNYIFSEEIADTSFKIDSGKTSVGSAQYLHIQDDKKIASKKYLTTLAFSGKTTKDEAKKEISMSYPDRENLHRGIELVNWIKTSISFKEPLDENSQFTYSIEFVPATNEFYTPDFTFYISPPPNYLVNNDAATVELLEKTGNGAGGRLNLIQSVSRASTLYYNRWKTEHHIQSRQMSRIIPGAMINSSPTDKPTAYKQLTIKFTLNNPSKQPLSTFVYGILLSAVLAFGIDYTRIMAIERFFAINHLVKPDIIWIIVSLLTFATMFLESIRLKDSKEQRRMKMLRIISVIGYIIWAFSLFVLFRSDASFLKLYIGAFTIGNMILVVTLIVSNLIFLLRAIFSKKLSSAYPLKSIFKF